ncbi:hypothetical protein AXG53_16710 [Stenotrophomonas sp. KCTC 12332]|nr:hypothetical protein AXG53_16710 [Stenotrophomonas sp. KCTC 12332]
MPNLEKGGGRVFFEGAPEAVVCAQKVEKMIGNGGFECDMCCWHAGFLRCHVVSFAADFWLW